MASETLGEVRTVWTARDEAALAELQERRARVMAARREPIIGWLSCLDYVKETERLTNALIADAERLRDLLLPFDGRAQG